MERYDRRMVTAPNWMQDFTCIAGECTETCCQQWNIDVDPVHAECYTHLGDPELQSIMNNLLHRFHIRRPGMRKPELQYRFLLLSQAENRCPLLNTNGECRLQKKYGAGILCDTCYFHPRTFWQIDDQIGLSACLSCPECARLALIHSEPTIFTKFMTEIDPNAEWLETALIPAPDTRSLMQNRNLLIQIICDILQNRGINFEQRIVRAKAFLAKLGEKSKHNTEDIRIALQEAMSEPLAEVEATDPADLMAAYLEVFNHISEGIEKPAQGISLFTQSLAGGREGFIRLLAANYEKGWQLAAPFFSDKEYLIENFIVHCVFSDSFKQFHRCQNEMLSPKEVLQHESSLLEIWYLFFRVLMSQASLSAGGMTEDLFLQTVIYADKTFWHYPDWFARCADRFSAYTAGN